MKLTTLPKAAAFPKGAGVFIEKEYGGICKKVNE